MSHEIDMSNDRANIGYVGTTPWHGLGTQLNPDTTLEEWKIAAGLDWTAERRNVLFRPYDCPENAEMNPVERTSLKAFPDRSVIIRSDTLVPLSIMSKSKFNILQPGAVIEFYRDLVESSTYSMETAGCLKGGRTIWALARAVKRLRVKGQDLIDIFLLFATSMDGTMSTVIHPTPVRVVCRNTMQASVGMNGKKASIRIPHMTKITPAILDRCKRQLGLVDGWIDNWESDVNTLADVAVDRETAVNYFVELYAKRDDKDVILKEQPKSLEKIVNALMARYLHGDGANLVSAKDTAWGLVNAVTGYIDHDVRARSVESRFNSAQYGAGKLVKAKAFEQGLKLAA